MNIRKMYTEKFKQKSLRIIAVYLAINILFECIAPTCAYALTGGPSQPEVQSFEPIGTSEMVDLFSGDFNYNIPLMDVDGYPINISYHSGVTMDQEASWVGLGWNLNPGVINRSMRGIPDDFNGETITKKLKMKENKTYGFNTGAGIELFGLEKLRLGLNYSIGVKYNNYSGISADQSLNISISAGDPSKSSLTGSLGLNSSSEDGLSLQPRISLSAKAEKNAKGEQNGLGVSVGAAFNSRSGLKALTMNVSQTASGKNMSDDKTTGSGTVMSSSFNLGQPTYTPQAGLSMYNLSVTGSFKLGLEAFALHPNWTIGGSYASQKLASTKTENPAFGYMYADEGTKYDQAILDFNREKDGPYTASTPGLAITNFTYDIYSVSGQGVGGSYRPFRSDMGHVFDPYTSTSSDGYSIGAEVGLGNVFHLGVDLSVNNVDGATGRWKDGNLAASKLTYRKNTGDPFYENYYFKEANEKSVDEDSAFYSKIGKSDVQTIALKQNGKFNTIADEKFIEGNKTIPSENYRTKRQRRNLPLSILTRAEIGYSLTGVSNVGYNVPVKPSHIAEITTLKNDGTRYVYGQPVYNITQEEVSFAVGKTLEGGGGRTSDPLTGLVRYNPGDNSDDNQLGLDNYYSNTIMPAYAHSYMLTAVLSPDYVDSDFNVPGPSQGDIGNYTKFNYNTVVSGYKWRVPVGKNQASYNEGLKSDPTDDKANYVYGSKDLIYVSSIETKNYVAVFTTEDRKDGYGVKDQDGECATTNPMKLLRKISLYLKSDYDVNGNNANPIKEVYFDYDYSLCPKVPNNINYGGANNNGKLTLKKISFSYQKSAKARFSPYTFTYGTSTTNYPYNIKAYDRWGNYKPIEVDGLPTAEFPYTEQDQTKANLYAQAWSLTEIYLPSGGKIKLDYESDDYAYVQDKQAAQMFKVVGVEYGVASTTFPVSALGASKDLNTGGSTGTRLLIKLQTAITGANADATFQKQYLGGLDYLYFRFLMDIRDGKQEYVSGYLKMEDVDIPNCKLNGTGDMGAIAIKSSAINDNGNGIQICPITKAAIQFGRLNMPRTVYSAVDETSMSKGFGKDLLIALINSDFSKNIADAIAGPNYSLYKAPNNVGKSAIMGKSWVRLNNPIKKKLGGGCRVKQIQMSDEWDGTGIVENTGYSYGQQYLYTMPDGTSSGVASYEPQLGGDENPWKIPVFFSKEKILAPDDEHYMEEPFGECFFPSASVGYSRVTVQNIQRKDANGVIIVKHNATGKVVHEFYTAKDFPTIATRSGVTKKQEKRQPLSLGALLNLKVMDYMTVTQGYEIEINDMAGKARKQSVYQQGQNAPITSVEYFYQSDPYLIDKSRLNNTSTVINSNGTYGSAQLGVFYDFVSDMRQSTNETTSASFNINTDGFVIPPLPALIAIPIGLPSFSNEKTQFRSAVVTKVIQRFGILSRTVAKDLGSTVETKNLAYDAESGEVLLTETTTDFNDKVYALTYPAYWYYNGMGPAYRNAGLTSDGITFSGGTAFLSNALTYFAEGDEIAMDNGNRGWVISVEPGIVKAVDQYGSSVSGKFLKVLRSGRRNQQNVPMATITTRSNPLTALVSNSYIQVLQAQAMEYTNTWKTFCDCFATAGRGSSNPYVTGTKGMYKNKKSYAYLSGRSQSNYNSNTDIRKDGMLTSYTPFYRLNAGNWEMDPRDWTFTSEVTEFSPFGAELENRDALNRYSAAQYGYNQTLPVGVAANSKYSNMATDNFEDYSSATCVDNHFKFRDAVFAGAGTLINSQSHSGKNSIRVTNGNSASITKQLQKCTSAYCNLAYDTILNTGTHTYQLTITGGVAPYTFDWESLNGDLQISIDPAGTSIYVKQLQTINGILNLTVTDKNKCKQTFVPRTIWHF
jgi:hypothetical protein